MKNSATFNAYKNQIIYQLMPRIEKAAGKMFHEIDPATEAEIFLAIDNGNTRKLAVINRDLCKMVDKLESK
jgi:hypothetical protein